MYAQSCKEISITYASEADVLNKALFGMTEKEWKDKNPTLDGNIRDYADAYQLIVLANIENLNAEYIRNGLFQSEKLLRLNESTILQMKSLIGNQTIKELE